MSTTYKKKSILFLAGVFSLFSFSVVQAAELSITPTNTQYEIGDVIEFNINVTSTDEPINALSFNVAYPNDRLDFVSLNKNTQLVSFWIENDSNYGDGSISLEGLLVDRGYQGGAESLATIRFQAKKLGPTDIVISEGSVHAYDGFGTNVLDEMNHSRIEVLAPGLVDGIKDNNIITNFLTEPEDIARELEEIKRLHSQRSIHYWLPWILFGVLFILGLVLWLHIRHWAIFYRSRSEKEAFIRFLNNLNS